ncbi:PREDICTED: uncharacterized protein LOC105558018 isoform X2 [Vollenhovia emeryi]|uniref:uncharacterized protein LOC105558018 isoform X2 n=1 Tax=Vollenhovia emeryi TaxID=411798 RepID=UPI0005F4FDA1|nr:PREDICTED: uncharacterized protein LOC105558018 isoform X2 [Vollenhovia emeryi]
MYAILIPFFLAADVVVNNTSEWTYGPEYLYDVNISFILKPEHHRPVEYYQVIATINCRPKMPDHLSCHFNNATQMDSIKNNNASHVLHMEEKFEIKFNERGVEGVIVEPNTPADTVNVIRKFATQFNVAVDRSNIGMSHFMVRENSSMGNCATTYSVTHENPGTDTEGDFRLVVLPLADAKPGTTLSIEKSRTECIDSPRHFEVSDAILEMERFVSNIQINQKKFESSSEIDAKVKYIRSEIEVWSNTELIHVKLNSIEPAKNELPMLFYGGLIDLNIKNGIPNNLIV